jgi:hypothetical protein
VGEAFAREFKVAPVGGRASCRVTPSDVEITWVKGKPKPRSFKFADAEHARFTEVSLIYAGTKTDLCSRLLMLRGHGRKFVLQQNGGTFKPRTNLQLRPYYEACVATLKALAKAKPDLQIELGMGPVLKWFFFVAGCVQLLLGGVLLLGIVMELASKEKSGSDLLFLGVLGLTLFVYGIGMAATSIPWRHRETVTPDELARSLEARL